MFCPECGFGADEARFCPECGTSLDLIRTVADEADPADGAAPARGPALPATGARGRTTGSRGRGPARNAQARPPKARPQPQRSQPARATRAQKPRHLSPAVIWMGVAGVAAVVLIAVFAFAQTPSDAADGAASGSRTTGSVAADTSGSYAALVQRGNGLYDQGAQAFDKSDENGGVKYFAAAAKVYAAAWKQQATDPNVGTDFATSLFYSGDTDGALKQVDAVLAKSPDFQTAHLNRGVYLQTASQTAKDGGQKARADSLLTQARAAYEKAVSIDPGSSAGAKAAESLKSL